MIGELWDVGIPDPIDADDVDDELDSLDDEPADEAYGGDDIEMWRAIRRSLPCKIEADE